jgi:hypothetical protein
VAAESTNTTRHRDVLLHSVYPSHAVYAPTRYTRRKISPLHLSSSPCLPAGDFLTSSALCPTILIQASKREHKRLPIRAQLTAGPRLGVRTRSLVRRIVSFGDFSEQRSSASGTSFRLVYTVHTPNAYTHGTKGKRGDGSCDGFVRCRRPAGE